jgi:AbrB family looped-hinge helix DNA binding protein
MQTKVSTKGQVVMPGLLRRKLDPRPGDPLDVNIEAGRIVLTPKKRRPRQARIISDPATGLSALSAGVRAPALTSKEVKAILTSFP